MDTVQKVLLCNYCGNTTLMDEVGRHKDEKEDGQGFYEFDLYQMFNCPICNNVTFHHSYWNVSYNEYSDDEVLYPNQIVLPHQVPTEIKKAYEAAIKVRYIDNALCLMGLRKTIELICINNDAKGYNLNNKIKDLAVRGILPEQLKSASDLTKDFGNMGAHLVEININSSDLNHIIEFVQYIIEYLYILPHKIESLSKKMK